MQNNNQNQTINIDEILKEKTYADNISRSNGIIVNMYQEILNLKKQLEDLKKQINKEV